MDDTTYAPDQSKQALRSVPIEVTIVVGRARPSVRELLSLEENAVLPLDRKIDDPVELFVDPEIRFPMLSTGWKLAKRKLGQRQLMDVISLKDTRLVKGTHGRITDDPDFGPLVISSEAGLLPEGAVAATDFKTLVLDHVFG